MSRPARTQFINSGSGWMELAACLGKDLDAAFPARELHARRFIRDNCNRCPVLSECAKFARDHKAEWGIWGGQLISKDRGTVDGL